jgi:TPR repeat protein
MSNDLHFAATKLALVACLLGVQNRPFRPYEEFFRPKKKSVLGGLELFLLKTMMRGLEKRRVPDYVLTIMQRISSKSVASVRDKAAEEAEELCASGKCAAALPLLEKAIDLGHLHSHALKAWLLIYGRKGVAKDRIRAFELAEKGARLGCHHCQGVMAFCYTVGFRCVQDVSQLLELAHKSSDMGSKYGHFALGCFNYFGLGNVSQNRVQAVSFFRLAAAQNLDEAQCELGLLHLRGVAQDDDDDDVLRWFHLAAAQGHPKACYWIANCYEFGEGVDENEAKAKSWYKCAKEAGYPAAVLELQRLCAE